MNSADLNNILHTIHDIKVTAKKHNDVKVENDMFKIEQVILHFSSDELDRIAKYYNELDKS